MQFLNPVGFRRRIRKKEIERHCEKDDDCPPGYVSEGESVKRRLKDAKHCSHEIGGFLFQKENP